MHLTINLSDFKNQPLNIGGVLNNTLEDININNIDACFLLQICNEIMHGSYTIPGAIGFSTPLHILGNLENAKINIRMVIYGLSNSIDLYNDWKNTYQDKLYNIKPIKLCYSSDKKECGICLQEYQLGEELYKLQICGHIFHKKCIDYLNPRTTCPICRCHAFRHPIE